MRTLLVEDDENIREVFKILLESSSPIPNMVVDAAASGQEAIESVRRHKPDLILLDLTLPEGNGFEVFAQLRSLPGCEDLQAIAVTAHVNESFKKQAAELGFIGYVTKPIDLENSLFPLLLKIFQSGQSKAA